MSLCSQLGEKGSGFRPRGAVQDFNTLRRECLAAGRLFEDPEFRAEDSSLYFSRRPDRYIEWKRPMVSSLLNDIIVCIHILHKLINDVLHLTGNRGRPSALRRGLLQIRCSTGRVGRLLVASCCSEYDYASQLVFPSGPRGPELRWELRWNLSLQVRQLTCVNVATNMYISG